MNIQEAVDRLKDSGSFESVYATTFYDEPPCILATPRNEAGGWTYDVDTFSELAQEGWVVLDVSEHNRILFGRAI